MTPKQRFFANLQSDLQTFTETLIPKIDGYAKAWAELGYGPAPATDPLTAADVAAIGVTTDARIIAAITFCQELRKFLTAQEVLQLDHLAMLEALHHCRV